MATWTTTIGENTGGSTDWLQWVGNYGNIDAGLVVPDEDAPLAVLLISNNSTRNEVLRTGTTSGSNIGPELTDAFEQFGTAIILRAGSLELVLPGPDHSSVSSTDDDQTEPYRWKVPAAKKTEIQTFITAYNALPQADKAATTVTLRDSLPVTLTIARDDSSITEGADATWTITADNAPESDLPVNVNVTQSGDFIDGSAPTTVTLLSGDTTVALTVPTEDDSADEPNGNITAELETGTGYTLGSSISASINVLDNDVPPDLMPDFGSATVANQTYTDGEEISALQLPEATGGDGTLVYSTSTLPAGFSFNPNNRQITGTPEEPGNTDITFTVTDNDGDTDTLNFTIKVSPSINSLDGQAGEVIRAEITVNAATQDIYSTHGSQSIGSISPDSDIDFTANITLSRLRYQPSNNRIILNQDGGDGLDTIFSSGDTGENATFYFVTAYGTVTVDTTDIPSGGLGSSFVRLAFTQAEEDILDQLVTGDVINFVVSGFVVPDTAPDFGSNAVSDQSYTQNTGITALQLPSATGGNSPLRYSTTQLPAGLAFNESTLRITGAPTAPGVSTIVFTVRDVDGDTDTLSFQITVIEINELSGSVNILIEIIIDENTTLRGGTARMRLSDDTTYYDFQVSGVSSLKQSVGNIENPRIVPENASIKLHKRALADYDLTRKAIKIINQKSLVAHDRVVLFDGFVRAPDGVRETQDLLMVDVESKFAKIASLIKLQTYNASAGADFDGKFIPLLLGHFIEQPARLHDSTRHAYIVSSFPMRFSDACPVKVYGDGAEIDAADYDIDYTNALIIFSASRSEAEITVDGCGVRYGHAAILKWLLLSVVELAEGDVDIESFDNVEIVPTSRVVVDNNTDAFGLISELLFESLHEMTFQNNRAVLHSRYAEATVTIPDSAILHSNNKEVWEEVQNTGRLYANHVYTEVGGTLYEYDDLAEQTRVGVISKMLNLKWYDFNRDDIISRLRALPESFASIGSAMVRASFDRRAIVATAGSVINVKGGSYYVLSRNLSYTDRLQIGCELWKRPNKALGAFISRITQDNASSQDVTIEYTAVGTGNVGDVFNLQLLDVGGDSIRTIGGLLGASRDETMADNAIYGANVARSALGIFGAVQGFSTYEVEVVTATNRPNAVRLAWNVGGNGSGDRTWADPGQKYRVEFKEDSQTWDEKQTRDFEGITTKVWQVDVDGLRESVQYNFRVFRTWDNVYFGITSAAVDGTPTSATLGIPAPVITQNLLTATVSWPDVDNATHYDVEIDGGGGAYVASTDSESPVTITTNAQDGDTLRARVRSVAFGYMSSAYGEASFDVTEIVLPAPQFATEPHTGVDSQVRMVWTPNALATEYFIQTIPVGGVFNPGIFGSPIHTTEYTVDADNDTISGDDSFNPAPGGGGRSNYESFNVLSNGDYELVLRWDEQSGFDDDPWSWIGIRMRAKIGTHPYSEYTTINRSLGG